MAWNPEWRLEDYYNLLKLQVRMMHLDPRLQRRFDCSDLVMDTFVKAHENRNQFKGQTEGELVKWLQAILANVVRDKIDYHKAAGRDVGRERYLDEVLDQSSRRLLAGFLVAEQSSPSQRAERHELLLRVAAAINQLDGEGDVIIHHHLLGTPVQQIAQEMGRTEKAVAMSLYWAMRKLRKILDTSS
jgi:RNA polymerase sigma-70 factor (ECF subfamily)